eukprot:TRINITY_DN4063_c0_g1_i1.p1 TRINITY_DN4063_c0_g1~~TRINITY_DN4063_c0_g1_i1.p1  ORF type:complete len:241 (-),score=27.76 TRINITY_DN4063_c0_g1_i1:7-684(-)
MSASGEESARASSRSAKSHPTSRSAASAPSVKSAAPSAKSTSRSDANTSSRSLGVSKAISVGMAQSPVPTVSAAVAPPPAPKQPPKQIQRDVQPVPKMHAEPAPSSAGTRSRLDAALFSHQMWSNVIRNENRFYFNKLAEQAQANGVFSPTQDDLFQPPRRAVAARPMSAMSVDVGSVRSLEDRLDRLEDQIQRDRGERQSLLTEIAGIKKLLLMSRNRKGNRQT